MLKRWFSRIRRSAQAKATEPSEIPLEPQGKRDDGENATANNRAAPNRRAQWEYKVVQMVARPQADPAIASEKLGGALSAESLKSQFPKYYNAQNARQQIADFLNKLGQEHWELVAIQEVANIPLMILKRPAQ